jgi:hypothetical protein
VVYPPAELRSIKPAAASARRWLEAASELNPKTVADGFDGERPFPADEIEEIETHRIGERTELVRLGQDDIADGVQP